MKFIIGYVLSLSLLLSAVPLWAEEGFYVVKKGDTLLKIARAYNVPVEVLAEVNNLKNPAQLPEGKKLLIPLLYTVQKGETLYSLSRQFKVSVADIQRINKLGKDQALKIGQKIYLPVPATTKPQIEQITKGPEPAQVFWPHTGERESYKGKISGVLIKGSRGDLVYSVSSGRVVWAGPYRGFGQIILISAADGLIYGYLGNDELLVGMGERIEAGSALARLGSYFHPQEAKLLFIIYNPVSRLYLDPEKALSQEQKN